ncbi:response regulator [Puteibacter caeruleilacunae]|nr:response regulator [Puteibacter caeruleilacunae]
MKKLTLLIVLLTNTWLLFSTTLDYNFISLSVENSLTHNTITSFFQDNQGEIWIGTENGLNRYDGINVFQYHHKTGDSTSLSRSHIKTIAQDHQGTIWVGTTNGLNKYLPQHNNFIPVAQLKNIACLSSLKDSQDNFWVGTNEGLYIQDNSSFRKINFNNPPRNISNITSILELKSGQLILISNSIVFHVYLNNNQIEQINPLHKDHNPYNFKTIFRDSRERIWLGGGKRALYNLINTPSGLVLKDTIPDIFTQQEVRAINEDEDGRIWVGTKNGLFILPSQGNIQHIVPNPNNPKGLSNVSITTILKDSYNSLWIGTYYGGVNIYRNRNNIFHNIYPSNNSQNFTTNVIRGMVLGRELIVGTEGSGIFNLTNHFQFKSHPYLSCIKSGIHDIYKHPDGTLWLATHLHGVLSYSPYTHKITPLGVFPPNSDISSIECDSKGDVWIASSTQGIVKATKHKDSNDFSFAKEEIPFGYSYSIKDILVTTNDLIIICTQYGLFIFNPSNNHLSTKLFNLDLKSIYSNEVITAYEDSNNDLWIGTQDNGLFKLDFYNDTIIHLTTGDGLPNNTINEFIEDKQGKIWVTTDQGLVLLNKSPKIIRYYNQTDGLPSNQFVQNSAIKDDAGNIYLGTVNGLTIFNPADIKPDCTTVTPIITDIQSNNKSLKYESSKSTPNYQNGHWNTIFIQDEQKSFSIHFTNYYYGSIKKLKFAYRIKELSEQWINTNSRQINFSSLPYGEYIFELKVKNPNETWSNKIAYTNIIILPPWWFTWQAWLVYAVILLAVAIIVVRTIRARIRLKNIAKINQVKREKDNEVNQMKLRFFTNISHEFRTPLSLISGPIESLHESEENPERKTLLEIASRNTDRLLKMINNLLDFRKAEQGFLEIKLKEVRLKTFVDEQINAFSEWAQKKNITINSIIDPVHLYWTFDSTKMASVFYNLLSNAIKFTPDGGQITINIQEQNSRLIISIKDTGKGMTPDQISQIFNRYYQVNQDDSSMLKGSGIGLALTKEIVYMHNGELLVDSIPDQETTFTISLPKATLPANNDIIHDVEVQSTAIKNDISNNKEQSRSKLPTLLIAEDNADLRLFLQNSLKEHYNIILTDNGQEALKSLKKKNVDIIISDVMMPVMDGVSFCKKVKTNIESSHIPFIFLSAKETITDQIIGMESGAEVYLPKPFHIKQLKAQLNNLIQLKNKQQEKINSVNLEDEKELNLSPMDLKFLSDLKKSIENNISNPQLSTAFLAEQLHMSNSTFYRKITAITGSGSNDYVRMVRLRKAAQLITQTDYSVSEIADQLGFSTPNYFTTSFTKEFGMSPTAYAKNKRRKIKKN